jgi:hypothetical protein
MHGVPLHQSSVELIKGKVTVLFSELDGAAHAKFTVRPRQRMQLTQKDILGEVNRPKGSGKVTLNDF